MKSQIIKSNLRKLLKVREHRLNLAEADLNTNITNHVLLVNELDSLTKKLNNHYNHRLGYQKTQFFQLKKNHVSIEVLSSYRASIKELKENERNLDEEIIKKKLEIKAIKEVIKADKKAIKNLNKKIEGLYILVK